MNKALSEPTHQKAFRDKYLAAKKGVAALILSAFLCLSSYAQLNILPTSQFGDIIPATRNIPLSSIETFGTGTKDTIGLSASGSVHLSGGAGGNFLNGAYL